MNKHKLAAEDKYWLFEEGNDNMIEALKEAAYEDKINGLKKSNEHLDKRNKELIDKVELLVNERDELIKHNKILLNKVESLSCANEELKKELEDLNQDCDDLCDSNRIKELEDQTRALQNTLNEYNNVINKLGQDKAKLRAQTVELKDKLTKNINHYEEQLERSRKEINGLLDNIIKLQEGYSPDTVNDLKCVIRILSKHI